MASRKQLRLAPHLSLSLDFATKTAAILAQRRKGKTYTASVIAEEMVAAKQPFVALDPTGAWWGLRAGADGKREGLPVVVLGGQHGDVPLERTGGRLIADLVVEEPGYYVIDFSLFESGEAERQFAVDFAERLYRAKGQAGKDFPLHLFVDEADRFIPQQMRKGSGETSPRLLGAFEAIVRRGGLRGLGTTLISQRAAVVNKNVLEMLDVLIVLRTVGPNDQAAILGYIKAHGTDAERVEMMGSLASLEIGEAWVWEPGAEPPLFQRVRIRARHTFNSSATPKAGEKRVEPKRLADVDLAALQTRMAETVEKAKAEDPRELKKTIAELKKQLGIIQAEKIVPPGINSPAKIREVLTAADRARLETIALRLSDVATHLRASHTKLLDLAVGVVEETVRNLRGAFTERSEHAAKAFSDLLEAKGFQKILGKLATVQPPAPTPGIPQARRPVKAAQPVGTPGGSRNPARPAGSGEGLAPGERKILTAVAQFGEVDRGQLTVLVGYKATARDTYISRLAQKGFVESGQGRVRVLQAGVDALGPDYEPLPTGDALLEFWRGRLPAGECKVLDAVVAAYPDGVTREVIGEQTAYKATARDTYISRLASRRLLKSDGRGSVRASEELFS